MLPVRAHGTPDRGAIPLAATGTLVIFGLIQDAATLVLIVACLYFAIGEYVRRERPAWSEPLEKRRLAILSALVLAVSAIKVSEDALGGESGPIDEAILRFIRGQVPATLAGFFDAVTFTGSSRFLFPLAAAVTIALLSARRRAEALLVAASVSVAAVVVYAVKTTAGRARPALWETQWYWGSSFPSGHTLVVAAFATSAVLCVGRIRPAMRKFALSIALSWILLVGFSRLVIGVHWPTDVLAAACIGACLPLAMSIALDLRHT